MGVFVLSIDWESEDAQPAASGGHKRVEAGSSSGTSRLLRGRKAPPQAKSCRVHRPGTTAVAATCGLFRRRVHRGAVGQERGVLLVWPYVVAVSLHLSSLWFASPFDVPINIAPRQPLPSQSTAAKQRVLRTWSPRWSNQLRRETVPAPRGGQRWDKQAAAATSLRR